MLNLKCFIIKSFIVAIGSIAIAWCQVPTAQITGLVTDPTGAVVSTAQVRLTNQATGIEQAVHVNSEGRYLFLAMPLGKYTMTADATGFKTTVIQEVVLNVGQETRLDVALEIGNVNEQVTVSGAPPLLQTEGATIGTVITTRQLLQLPLNGRNFVELTTLAPGAADGFSQNYQVYKFGERAQYSVVQADGVRSEFTQTTFDGINTQTIDRHWTSVLYPSVDMIAEVKSETSNYTSQDEGGGGVMINAVTKSGTNEFHGSAFEFLQNRDLNARNFFLPPNDAKPDEKYNQFGGTVGGPIWKNKTFFFGSYQGQRINTAFVNQTRVPTAKERQGDFSESLAVGEVLMDPNTTVVDPSSPVGYSRSPFPGNIIPANRINPLAVQLTSLGYPLPTDPQDRIFNFKQVGANPDNSNQYAFRIDHQLTSNDSIFGRWMQDRQQQFSVGLEPNRGSISGINGYSGVLGWNHSFGPTLLNEVRLGYTRYVEISASTPSDQLLVGPGSNIPLAGLDNIPINQRHGLCCFRISGLASMDYGTDPGNKYQNSYQLNDKLNWTYGKHTISFGGSVGRNEDYSPLNASLLPSRTFHGDYTGNPFGIDPTQQYDTGYADFLLGISSEISPQEQLVPQKLSYFYQNQFNAFFDDQFRINRGLTISLGLGYVYSAPLKEKNDQMAFFDYRTGQVVYPKGITNELQPYLSYLPYPFRTDGPNQMFQTQKDNFQPRIAIAWTPWGSKTVIRTGYALYYATPSVANLVPMATIPPFEITGQRNVTALFPADAFQLALPETSPDLAIAFSEPSLQLGEYNMKTPYTEMWNFDIQRELTKDIVATVAYVGNEGKHINLITRPNSPPPGPGDLQSNRPYPLIGRMINVAWEGISNYNGLQASVRKTLSKGLIFTVAYSYSKSLGDTDDLIEISTFSLEMAKNIKPYDYGRAAFDYRHIFRSSFIQELPFGKGRRYLNASNRFVDGVLGGWQLSGIITLQSGQAFSPYGGGDLNNQATSRPDRVCDGSLSSGQRTLFEDFDTSCFVNHQPFVEGTTGRNVLTSRPLKNLDLGIDKSFALPFKEDMKLQVRGEMFNATNTPFFSLPDAGCCGSADFGRISSTDRPARVVQMGVRVDF